VSGGGGSKEARGGVFGFNAALSYCVEGGEEAGIHLWVIVLEILFVGGAG